MDGVTGIYSPDNENLTNDLFLATGALQHRGNASAGIAIATKHGLYLHKGLGRIGDVVGEDMIRMFTDLHPVAGIGNVGYTKKAIPEKTNAEPILASPHGSSRYDVAVAVNGYLVEDNDILPALEEDYNFRTSNKAEVSACLLHRAIEKEGVTPEAGKIFLDDLDGRATFAITALVYDKQKGKPYMIALNDATAFEPFCFGNIHHSFVSASESIAHRRLGGFATREYFGGEMTICSDSGINTSRLEEKLEMADIFQAAYFGNVGSTFNGKQIMDIRRELGHELVDLYGNPGIDIVIPNPESGWGVSLGIAEALGMMCYPALPKQSQAVRTFQEGLKTKRTSEVNLKFAGIDSLLSGKRVLMGDDSIVKGSVSEGGSVWWVYNCGAIALHFWPSYGAMFFPSFKEWRRGKICVEELAVQRAFVGDNPYDKPLDEINRRVAAILKVNGVGYNTKERIQKAAGDGSFQALDASYPIDEKFWPGFIKKEVEKFHKYAA